MPELADRLRDDQVCWVATTRPDGRPHLTPIWFVWAAERFWLCTLPKAVKAANLAAEPRVSVALEGGKAPAVAEGRAVLHLAPPFPAEAVAGFVAKYDWDIDHDGEGYTTLIEIVVDRWLMNGGPIGGGAATEG
ncbi:MAG: pyridoxamine 5'-phosphate oxidase family protein [Acidimicrobiales bacterium]